MRAKSSRLPGVVLACLAAAAGAPPMVAVAAHPRAGVPTRAGPSRAATVACANGPCASPTPVAYLPTGGAAMVVANFGLLMADQPGPGWQVVCDDVYGTPTPEMVRRDGRGRLFAAAGLTGLVFSDDGCGWTRAGGVLVGREVHDLAFEAGAAGRVWALAGEPRVLAVSSDGGATFELVHAFDDGRAYQRLMVAPSDARRLYAVAPGPGGGASTILATSADGGARWRTRDLLDGLAAPPDNALALVAIAPADPQVLFFSVVDAFGDEIWRSEEGASPSVRRVLKGGPRDWMTGVAFGADGQTMYASASVLPVLAGDPPGRLYISRDGGRSWGLAVSAAPTGPSYRCLHSVGGTLYACGLGEPGGEDFLVGSSTDEGKTWKPLLRLDQLTGIKSCVRAACAATEAWLCDRYGRCGGAEPSPTPEPPPAGDGGAAVPEPPDSRDAGLADGGGGGCGCALGSGGERGPAFRGGWLVLLVAAAVARRSRARRRR